MVVERFRVSVREPSQAAIVEMRLIMIKSGTISIRLSRRQTAVRFSVRAH
jgi:hypothetical protein